MKDMSLEELLDEAIIEPLLADHKAELLRRFEKLEKYNHKLLNEDIRVNNELNAARKRARDLECCGNCKHSYSHCYGSLMCKKLDQSTGRGGYCSNWTTDGLTREEREK